MPVPDPPAQLRPRTTTWSAGQALIRVHPLRFGPAEFNPGHRGGVKGRFHFFRRAEDDTIVPVLYGAENRDAAIAEALFRDVSLTGPTKVIPRHRLNGLALSTLRPARDLMLIELLGYGLRRLELLPEQLTSTGPEDYPRTMPWAKALHAAVPKAHGLVWMSRLFNSARSVMLFGDRVSTDDLLGEEPIALAFGPGLMLVEAAANAAGIVVAD